MKIIWLHSGNRTENKLSWPLHSPEVFLELLVTQFILERLGSAKLNIQKVYKMTLKRREIKKYKQKQDRLCDFVKKRSLLYIFKSYLFGFTVIERSLLEVHVRVY